MNDPLKALLDAGVLDTSSYPTSSRYHGTPTAIMTDADGESVAYLKRRFVPSPERFSLVQQHTVVEGDRPDNLAALYLGDPHLFWRLCDANGVMRPDELVETPGRRIAITLPADVPGESDAE